MARRRIETELRLSYGRLLAERAARKVRPHIKSRTLREALRVTTNGRTWWIGVPHYWAVYYHDTRGPARAGRTRFLVWYPNPADDPRTFFGKYPVKRSEIRRLDMPIEQLRRDIRAGRAIAAQMSPQSGGRARGDPFFVKGLRGFFAGGGGERARIFARLAKSYYPKLYKVTKRKVKIIPPILPFV